VLADGKNVDGDVRAEPTDLLFVVVRRLSDVLVLKVSVHRDVTLKSVKKNVWGFVYACGFDVHFCTLHNNHATLEFIDRINNTSFYSELTNWLDKLECYNTPGWK